MTDIDFIQARIQEIRAANTPEREAKIHLKQLQDFTVPQDGRLQLVLSRAAQSLLALICAARSSRQNNA